jgi:hypothetical protein
MFCYQKIRRKILPRLQYELAARPYAHSSFVGEQKHAELMFQSDKIEFL